MSLPIAPITKPAKLFCLSFKFLDPFKSLVIFTILLLVNNSLFSQWQWLNPKPAGYNCNKIVFTDNQRGFMFNANGDLFKTEDQGKSWRMAKNFPNGVAMDIQDSTGVICGYGTVYISVDNGNNWQQIIIPFSDNFQTISIISRDTFYITNGTSYSSGYGNIYQTTDRGKSWNIFHCNVPINSINFVDSKIGFVGSAQSKILRTDDGGKTWQQKHSANIIPSTIFALQFIDKDTGYAFQEYSQLLKTTDGGKTWSASDVQQTMYTMQFLNSSLGYLGGSDGALYKTQDGGKTFSSIGFANGFIDGNTISSLFFLSKDTGFVVGLLGRIMKTENGGKDWASFATTYSQATSINFPSKNIGYFTTGNTLYKTKDGGQSWKVLGLKPPGSNQSSGFEQTHFINADSGFVTSSFPDMVHFTFDGGDTWKHFVPSEYGYDNINQIQFLTPLLGFMTITQSSAGTSGTILKTIDGGITWKKLWAATYMGEYFSRIFYFNEAIGYAIRYNQLYKTTDSSKTWSLVNLHSDYYGLTGLYFLNMKKGFATNEDNDIFLTSDSGKTWTSSRLSGQYYNGDIETIKFYNEQVGYITTSSGFGPYPGGNIFKTIDGGQRWETSYNVGGKHIEYKNDSTVLIIGYGGEILTSPIKELRIDSLQSRALKSCYTELAIKLTAALTKADSIYFELTDIDGKSQVIAANPSKVQDNSLFCTAIVKNLIQGKSYKLSAKYYSEGIYNNTNPVYFNAQGFGNPPVIGSSGNILTSSYYQYNQWFRNDSIIANAINQTYTVPKPIIYHQCYKVMVNDTMGCSSVSDTVCFYPSSVLAVDLLNFNAVYKPAGAFLSWQTTPNQNTDQFLIERSTDGSHFLSIGNIKAEETNLEENYRFTDTTIFQLNTSMLYYRLIKVSKDGKTEISNVITLSIPRQDIKVSISPNPASNIATLHFDKIIASAEISIFNNSGIKIFSNYFKASPRTSYDLPAWRLQNGMYTVYVKTDKGIFIQRLLIIK